MLLITRRAWTFYTRLEEFPGLVFKIRKNLFHQKKQIFENLKNLCMPGRDDRTTRPVHNSDFL